MSDLVSYIGCYDYAKESEANGDLLEAAINYWMCTQYAKHGEFSVMPDTSLASEASDKIYSIQSRLPFAPLSKTTFIKGCQCLKSLWLYRNKYDQRFISSEVQQKFHIGHIIGELAQNLFPKGYDASSFSDIQKNLQRLQGEISSHIPNMPYRIKQNLWLKQTKELIRNNCNTIYEAAFTHDVVFAAIDILKFEDTGYVAYEVKSSFDVKDVYIHDCALQYYVMSHNIELSDMYLVYPNEDYISSLGISIDNLSVDNCDVSNLFTKKSILKEVLALQKDIEIELENIKPILSKMVEPKIKMGEQCDKPYVCDFIDYCSKNRSKGFFSLFR